MGRTLYLMRHAKTVFNEEHIIHGRLDAPLSDFGIGQAMIARDYIVDHGLTFDHAYSSPSQRARRTLEIVTDNSIPYTCDDNLLEIDFGDLEGKSETLMPPYPFSESLVKYGGESEESVAERASAALDKIMQREGHYSVLVMTHGVVCSSLTRKWTGKSPENSAQDVTGISNCAILIYDYNDGIFTLKDIINHDFSSLTP